MADLSPLESKSKRYDGTRSAAKSGATRPSWRGGRVVEGARLESEFTLTGNVGSNPTFSDSNRQVADLSFINENIIDAMVLGAKRRGVVAH